MVRKRAENGTFYHHPPYTWEEEQALYKSACAGPFTVLRGPGPAKPQVQAHPQPKPDREDRFLMGPKYGTRSGS